MDCSCSKARASTAWVTAGIPSPPAISSGWLRIACSGSVLWGKCPPNILFTSRGIAILWFNSPRNKRGHAMQITVDLSRLLSELETLASFSDAPAPAVTRVVFSAQDLAARAYLRQLFSEAALTWRTDAVGNTFARWTGADPSLA